MVVLQQAGKLRGTGKLVFGRPASGKSSFVIEDLQQFTNVLWLYTNNTGALVDNPQASEWLTAEINDMSDIRDILRMFEAGELDSVEAIVIDGLEGLRDFALVDATAQSDRDFTTQNDWGEAGRTMDNTLRALREHASAGVMYGICNVFHDEKRDTWKLALNPDATGRMMSLFGEKVHTYTTAELDEDDNLVIKYRYATGEEATLLVNIR